MIPAPKGRYPPAKDYRLNNEDQLATNIPRSIHKILALLNFLSTLCVKKPSNRESPSPDQQNHVTTDKGLPAPRRVSTLAAQVAGAFRELR